MIALNALLKKSLGINLSDTVSISALCIDSRTVTPGALFMAYPGMTVDGRQFITDAMARGAAAIVCEGESFQVEWRNNIPLVTVPDLAQRYGLIARTFYGEPDTRLCLFGVTGTNGKTSSTYILAHALKTLGKRAAIIGTLGYGEIATALTPLKNTTPDAVTLYRILAQYVQQGIDVVIMEVSSHALDQGRVVGLVFDIALLTNVTQDHLDYHHHMDAYFAAKQRLFLQAKKAVLNVDDPRINDLTLSIPTYIYGLKPKTAITPFVFLEALHGQRVSVYTSKGRGTFHSPLLGLFNVSNLLGALACLLQWDIALEDALNALETVLPVPGRMDTWTTEQGVRVVVDYAHTPDALEKVLESLASDTVHALWCVFGCGGDRDKTKRPLMARAVYTYADHIVVTQDNPRFENPDAILQDIMAGFKNLSTVTVESDRREAIRYALMHAVPGDTVLIAGKGHEAYQEIAGVRHVFDDKIVAQEESICQTS